MADYDRDGFLDLYLCAYGYFIGVSEDKAGPPNPYHDALNGSPNALLRNDGRGRFVEVTDTVGLDHNNDRFSFAPAWGDYDADGWPDLFVANDFGRKNLYRASGAGASPRFEDVAAAAGVEDYGAGMSATFLDYDNDGRLDIYTGNMWTAAGQRVTAVPGFKPDAPQETRDIYRRHVRGNALFRNRGDGTFEDVTLAAHAEFGRWAWSSDALDFDNDGWEDLYIVNGMFTREDDEPAIDVDSFFWRQVVGQSPLTRTPGTRYDDGWRATNRLLVADGAQAQHERNVLLRNNGQGGFDEISGTAGPRHRSGWPLVRRVRLRRRRRFRRAADGAALVTSVAPVPERLRLGSCVGGLPSDRDEEQSRRRRRARDRRDGPRPSDACGEGGVGLHLAALEGTALRDRRKPAHRQGDDQLAERSRAELPAIPREPSRVGAGGQRRAQGGAISNAGSAPLCSVAQGSALHVTSGASACSRTRHLALRTVSCARLRARDLGGQQTFALRARRPPRAPLVLGDVGPAVSRRAGGARGARRRDLASRHHDACVVGRFAGRRGEGPRRGGDGRSVGRGSRGGRRRHVHDASPVHLRPARGPAAAHRVPAERQGRGREGVSGPDRPCAGARGRGRHRSLRTRESGAGRAVSRDVLRADRRTQLLPVRAGAVGAGLRCARARRVRARRSARPERHHVPQSRHAVHEGRSIG